jgi:hypothetical protein
MSCIILLTKIAGVLANTHYYKDFTLNILKNSKVPINRETSLNLKG